jgi:tetratricopeptide (TPR) repeat protein
MKMTMQATRTEVDRRPAGRGPRWAAAFGAAVLVACLVAAAPQTALGQAADRVSLLTGPGISGRVLSVSPATVDVEGANGEAQKISVETIREVQFGAEPQTLRSARAMLMRGRGADALDEVGKIEASELDGAEPLVLAEVEFVKAAAAGKAVLQAGGDLAAATKTVSDYLGKQSKSHHVYQMQELLGDLLARAGKADEAIAAYAQLASGPTALQVRAATAKAAMLLSQKKPDAALAEYEAAIKLAAADAASQPQKRFAELGRARCLALQGKHEPAVADVLRIIKAANPEEKELLAKAYTVLGATYQAMEGKDQDALISYLTVDLVYNTDPDSHAEALFHLGELWDRGSNPERAREARQNLKSAYPASRWAEGLGAAKS